MPIELKIPAVGESITEVQISEWRKSEGDLVKQDETIAVIDSEKATLDLPAPQNGRIVKILHQVGETVAVGAVVAHLEVVGEAGKSDPVEKTSPPKPASEAANSGEAKIERADSTKVENSKADSEKKSAPKAIKAEPVSKAGTKAPAPNVPPTQTSSPSREEEIVPMTILRRTVARRLVEAQQTMAMLTTFNEADMSAVQMLRQEHQEAFEKRYSVKLGLMSFFIKATIDALKQFPQLNAEVRGNDVVYRNYFDIGVAIATERGLVVPTLRNAGRLSFAEVEKAVGDFARRAKDGKLKPDELEGGTFSITNGGSFGSLLSTPIINPPQAGILGMHAIQQRPVVVQGQIVIRPMMYLALTYDHRIVDGREAVWFLRRVKEVIEAPPRMLIEV